MRVKFATQYTIPQCNVCYEMVKSEDNHCQYNIVLRCEGF